MNKDLFKNMGYGNVKSADAVNPAGGRAYELSNAATLSQLVLTGCLNNTFYTSDVDQLKQILDLCNKCDIEFVAKLAVYARQHATMKDSPSLLCAFIASKNVNLLKKIFPLVINDGKMLRNFVQIIRSGVVGRKSFGSAPKKLIQNYLNGLTDEQLFRSTIGNSPTLADIIKMVHPKAANEERNSLYAYILGKKYNTEKLLPVINQFEAFKKDINLDIPNVPFEMLTSLELTDAHWKFLARRATWRQIRANLNTFARHNVFNDKELVATLANRIQDPDEVRRSRVLPYQLFSAFINVDETVPMSIKLALQVAAEIAIENVPKLEGNAIIALDVSGSMREPITGKRGSASSKMKSIDVASMFAAAVMRKNPLTTIIPFDTAIKKVELNPLDSVMTNAQKLANSGANGGTDCGIALAFANENNMKAKYIIMISDNQSILQSNPTVRGETSMVKEWNRFKHHNKSAKMINIDISPFPTTQAYPTENVLHCSGFSDAVFDVVSSFVNDNETLLDKINSIQLENMKDIIDATINSIEENENSK